jgi:hypothetical protein
MVRGADYRLHFVRLKFRNGKRRRACFSDADTSGAMFDHLLHLMIRSVCVCQWHYNNLPPASREAILVEVWWQTTCFAMQIVFSNGTQLDVTPLLFDCLLHLMIQSPCVCQWHYNNLPPASKEAILVKKWFQTTLVYNALCFQAALDWMLFHFRLTVCFT